METKTFSFALGAKVLDGALGIVEHLVAVMGNVDHGQDVIHSGAFSKTIQEQGTRIRVLDQHDTSSVESVVGKPLELREIGRMELPSELLAQYPEATGGLLAKTQFLLDTARGREVFARIQAGAINEYSIGYDPITFDFTTREGSQGKGETIRNLRELRLWEYGPVIFGMNPATTTLSAKQKDPTDSKPYRALQEDGQYCVYKLTQDGQPTGDSLGCHETMEEALAQIAALYAAEDEDAKGVAENATEPEPVAENATEPEPVAPVAKNATEPEPVAPVAENATGDLEAKAGRVLAARNVRRLQQALATISEVLKDAGLLDDVDQAADPDDDEDKPKKGIDAASDAANVSADDGAGPDAIPPTPDLKAVVARLTLELLEV